MKIIKPGNNKEHHNREAAPSRAAMIDVFHRAVTQGSTQEAALQQVVSTFNVDSEQTRRLLIDSGYYVEESSQDALARVRESGGSYTVRLNEDSYFTDSSGHGHVVDKGTTVTIHLPPKREATSSPNTTS